MLSVVFIFCCSVLIDSAIQILLLLVLAQLLIVLYCSNSRVKLIWSGVLLLWYCCCCCYCCLLLLLLFVKIHFVFCHLIVTSIAVFFRRFLVAFHSLIVVVLNTYLVRNINMITSFSFSCGRGREMMAKSHH